MIEHEHPSEEWQEELQDAPLLKSLKQQSAMQAPDGYFDRLGEELQDFIDDQEAMEQAPTLSQLPKVQVFQVPKGYFEHVRDRILGQIGGKSQKSASVRSLWRPAYGVAIAAAVSLLVLAGIWLRPTQVPLELGDISEEELMASIQWEEIPTETLIEVLGEGGLVLEEEVEVEFPEEDFSELLESVEDGELEDLFLDI